MNKTAVVHDLLCENWPCRKRTTSVLMDMKGQQRLLKKGQLGPGQTFGRGSSDPPREKPHPVVYMNP